MHNNWKTSSKNSRNLNKTEISSSMNLKRTAINGWEFTQSDKNKQLSKMKIIDASKTE